MTTRAAKDRKPGATLRKTKKLALSKKTLSDLTPGRREAGAVRGGAPTTNLCSLAAGCN